MMFEPVVLIIFVLSFGGVLFILAGKIPVLATLPKNGKVRIKKHPIVADIEKRIKEVHFDLFVKKLLLHKILSWAKCLVLRVEVLLDNLLHGIRKNAQQINKPK